MEDRYLALEILIERKRKNESIKRKQYELLSDDELQEIVSGGE